jgi:hypothetical protein
MTYDIFISYRREGGFETAKMVQEKLKSLGYKVFLDFEDLRFGKFNEQLYTVISECKDFVVIMSPGCLDRCQNTDDLLRLEVLHAIKNKRNIIPIMMHKFSWPDTMPAGMEELKFMNVLSPNNEIFDVFIERLVSYLKSKKSFIRKIKRLWFVLAVIIVVVLFFIFYNSKYEFQGQLKQYTTSEIFAINDWNPGHIRIRDTSALSHNSYYPQTLETFGEMVLKDLYESKKAGISQLDVAKIRELLKSK